MRITKGQYQDLEAGVSYFPTKTLFCTNCESVSCGHRLGNTPMAKYYKGYQSKEFLAQRMSMEPSFGFRMRDRSSPNTLRARGEETSYGDEIDEYLLNMLPALPQRALDFGGGTGSNSPLKRLIPVDVYDIDEEVQPPLSDSTHWPLISIMNVLEHVTSPINLLRRASKLLSNNQSHILVEVPLEGFMRGQKGSSTFWQKKTIWTEHLNCFTPLGLEICFREAGLKLITPVTVREFWSDPSDCRESGAVLLAVGCPI